MDNFFYMIILYFCLVLFAFIFCHGNIPLKKYINTYPIDYISSLRDCYIPICVDIDAYLAVPVNYLPSLYGICFPYFIYLLANPISTINIICVNYPLPISKLSGLISRCKKCLLCKYLIRSNSC